MPGIITIEPAAHLTTELIIKELSSFGKIDKVGFEGNGDWRVAFVCFSSSSSARNAANQGIIQIGGKNVSIEFSEIKEDYQYEPRIESSSQSPVSESDISQENQEFSITSTSNVQSKEFDVFHIKRHHKRHKTHRKPHHHSRKTKKSTKKRRHKYSDYDSDSSSISKHKNKSKNKPADVINSTESTQTDDKSLETTTPPSLYDDSPLNFKFPSYYSIPSPSPPPPPLKTENALNIKNESLSKKHKRLKSKKKRPKKYDSDYSYSTYSSYSTDYSYSSYSSDYSSYSSYSSESDSSSSSSDSRHKKYKKRRHHLHNVRH